MTIIIAIFLLMGCINVVDIDHPKNSDITDTTNHSSHTISIACWNLQIFGPDKASNETLLKYYAEKLDDYDIFIVKEIRDTTGTAIGTLAERFLDYKYIIQQPSRTECLQRAVCHVLQQQSNIDNGTKINC